MLRLSMVSCRGAAAFLVAASVFLASPPGVAGLLGNAVGAWPAGLAANSLNKNLVGGLTGALDRVLSGALSDSPGEAEAAFDDAKYAIGKTARDMIPGAALLDRFGARLETAKKRLQTAKRRIGDFLGSPRAALGPAAAGASVLGAGPLPKTNLRAALPAPPSGGAGAAASGSPDPWSAAAPPDPWAGAAATPDPWANVLAGGAGAADPWAPAAPAAPTIAGRDIAESGEDPPAGGRDSRYALAVGGAEAKSFDDALADLRQREREARLAAERAEREAAARRERERAEAERRKAEARRERERREAAARRERERQEARNRELDRIDAQNRADNWNMFFEGVGNALNAYNDSLQQQAADIARRQQQARLEAERQQREWQRREEARVRQDDERRRAEMERQRQADARRREAEARQRQEEERRRAEAQRRAEEERRREAERQARENRREICRAMLAGSRTSCVEVGEWVGGGAGWRLKNNCNYAISVYHNFPGSSRYGSLTRISPHGRAATAWAREGRRKLRYVACVDDGGVGQNDGRCVVHSWACADVQ